MNKALILKYKKEFDHWLNEGEVLFFTWKWYNSKDNPEVTFNHSEPEKIKHYIINDEYVEFRKALAEGKTIQCNAREDQTDITYAAFGHNWWVDTTEFIYPISFYRIKPEEPQFKVGDWVQYTDLGSDYGGHILKIEEIDERNKPLGFVSLIGQGKTFHSNFVKLWKPLPQDWCWNSVFGLVKVLCESKSKGHFICWDPLKNVEQTMTIDEPFIGNLPSFLKDN